MYAYSYIFVNSYLTVSCNISLHHDTKAAKYYLTNHVLLFITM